MTPQEIKKILPNASKSTIDLNSGTSDSPAESGFRNGILETSKAQKGNPAKRVVRITSYRIRLGDSDSLVGKWHLDALRYAGAISDDTEALLDYKISQKKVSKKNQQRTLIEIT